MPNDCINVLDLGGRVRKHEYTDSRHNLSSFDVWLLTCYSLRDGLYLLREML